MTSYQKQYYGSYLSVSSAITFIGPGKLKGTQALKKVEDKAKEVIQKGRTVVLAKGIKSIDMNHINMRHAYDSPVKDASKYLKGANIDAIVREGYGKSGKKFKETISDLDGKSIPSIEIEVDFYKKIGTNSSGNGDYTILRMVSDYAGNIISAYPVASFKPYN